MKHYIGIDLGTTNSAICSFDGASVRVWKSPEQNDVTPSAIYVDRRGNRYFGKKAYDMAPSNEANSATLFKRYMGTSTKFRLESSGLCLSPEECSAEILKVLYGYLPEEVRSDPESAVVITVPAAFNQIKKDATLEAARLAGIGRAALIQEPVAAVMSSMRVVKQEGVFLVYDLGGGTFDVSIAENIGGQVNLLAQGGKEMCGGRDWDRMIFNSIVVPWLRTHFHLPEKFLADKKYHSLRLLALWACEQTKIELSSGNDSIIRMDENTLRCTDLDNNEIYLDIPITRSHLNALIDGLACETIAVTRETLSKAGLTPGDIDRIIFIGGPTNYKPLRDKVSSELSIAANTDVNPMTAVAEGACIFAESLDWSDGRHNRKASNAKMVTDLNVDFLYTARTAGPAAKVYISTKHQREDLFVEIISLDSGWSSGRAPLADGTVLDLPLIREGDNIFKTAVYDSQGRVLPLPEGRIVIAKTFASIGAIPASHSIGVEVMDKLHGTPVLDFLVKEGDSLPKKGKRIFKAGRALVAGSPASINIKLWEGEIQNPISDNRFIGMLKIMGSDFDSGIVPTGAEIQCEFEISDGGAIHLDVSIPAVGANFQKRNFYSRQEGQIDLTNTEKLAADGQRLYGRIEIMAGKVDDSKLDRARDKVMTALSVDSEVHDPEEIQEAFDELLEAKRLVARTRQEHLASIRRIELELCLDYFNSTVRSYANSDEIASYERFAQSAQRSIDRGDGDCENQLLELKGRNFNVLWRQEWFVERWFKDITAVPGDFSDPVRFERLKSAGDSCLENGETDRLRGIVSELTGIRISDNTGEDMFDDANIIHG